VILVTDTGGRAALFDIRGEKARFGMNGSTVYLVLQVLLSLGATLVLFRAIAGLRAYFRLQGTRLVTCPETNRPAAVELDAEHAAEGAVFGNTHFRLSKCSRWPERRDCSQCCLEQVKGAPEDTLVQNTAKRWYAGQKCVYCHKPILEVEWLDHRAALLGPDGKTVEWTGVPAQELPDAFCTHVPVCWNCHIAQTFHREHQELVVDRPWRWGH
jgi:hypothetical protein